MVKYTRKFVKKILNLEINYKELNNLLKQKHFDFKVQQDKLLSIYHNFTMEVFLPQIINNKKHTKTACLRRESVKHIIRNNFNFIKGFSLISTK